MSIVVRTAEGAREATGWTSDQWLYFLVQSHKFFARNYVILGLPQSSVAACSDAVHEGAKEVAETIKHKHGGYITNWKDVKPMEAAIAAQLARDQLRLESVPVQDDAVYNAVFRWRMMEALRYRRRKQAKEEHSKAEGSAIDEVLRNADVDNDSD